MVALIRILPLLYWEWLLHHFRKILAHPWELNTKINTMFSEKLLKLNPRRRMFCMRSTFCSCKDWITCVGIWKKSRPKWWKGSADGQGNASYSLPHASYICWYIEHPAVEKYPDESSINTGSLRIEKMSAEKLTRTERHLKKMESTVFTVGSHSTVFYGLLLSCQILIQPSLSIQPFLWPFFFCQSSCTVLLRSLRPPQMSWL